MNPVIVYGWRRRKSSGGHPRSRTGVPAKGLKLEKGKRLNKFIIERKKKNMEDL